MTDQPTTPITDRELIDFIIKDFRDELTRRHASLDMNKIATMHYWLDGIMSVYAEAFDVPFYERKADDGRYARQPSQPDCMARIESLEAYIADRKRNEDHGRADQAFKWLRMFRGLYEQATGERVWSEPEGRTEEPPEPTPEATSQEPARAELPMHPAKLAELPWLQRKSKAAEMMGVKIDRSAGADEVARAYAEWYATEYKRIVGSEPAAA